MSEDLPEGWARTTLFDVTERVSNIKPESEPKREFGYVDISSVDRERARIQPDEIRRFLGIDAPSRARRPIQPDDILLSNVRTNRRNVALIDRALPAQLCSTGFTVLRPNAAVLPEYILRWVQTDRFTAAITETQTGTHYPATNDSEVLRQVIHLPPLAEQRRIAAKVEALLDQLNQARARLARVPLILKRFRQAVLAAACSGKLTDGWRGERNNVPDRNVGRDVQAVLRYSERSRTRRMLETLPRQLDELRQDEAELPDGWFWFPLDTLASRVTDGTHQPPPLTSSGIPFLLIGNIMNGRIRWDGISKWVSTETYSALTERCRPEKGDVLYTAVGATYGQAMIVEWDFPFVFQRHIAHIKPLLQVLEPEYLALVLNAPRTYALATELARGAAQPTVTLGDIKTFPIPLCPLLEQREIVRRARKLLATVESVGTRLAAASRRAEKLPQAILSKAFSGELVPTEAELARNEGREFEPASILLDRLAHGRPKDKAPQSRTSKNVDY